MLFYSIQETHVREKTSLMTESTLSHDTRDVVLDITLSSENLDEVRNGYLRGILLLRCIFP